MIVNNFVNVVLYFDSSNCKRYPACGGCTKEKRVGVAFIMSPYCLVTERTSAWFLGRHDAMMS